MVEHKEKFFYHLAKNAKYKLDLNQLNKNEYMIASIESMLVNNNKIEKLIKSIIETLIKKKAENKKLKLFHVLPFFIFYN
mgnify:CR=1 FL=1